MTTEEKLEHFQQYCMESARVRSARMLDEYTQALEKSFSEHQEDARRRADMEVQAEKEKIQKETNKKLSIEQINIRRVFSRRQRELKEKLFVELRDMLANFIETPQYIEMLERQIAQAMEVAGSEPVIIYMDPSDEEKVRRLSFQHKADIRISEYSFLGGTRAVIPSKNILMDNSFETRMAEEKENFQFDLEVTTGGGMHG